MSTAMGLTACDRPLSVEHRADHAREWDGRTLSSFVFDLAAAPATRSRIAVVDDEMRLTYGDLDRGADRVAAALLRSGVAPGDTVSWQLPNWWEAIVVHHGILRAGAVSNPLMTILRERELGFMLRQARTKVLFVPGTFRGVDFVAMSETLAPTLPDLVRTVVVRPDGDDARAFGGFLGADGPVDSADLPAEVASRPALLLYTSGTESMPKGAVHSQDTIGYENRSLIELFALGGDDVVFMPSPLPHITGIAYGIHLAPMIGGTVVLQSVWEPGRGLELLERERCTFTVGSTPFLHMLAHHPELPDRDVSALRVFGCGGADVSPALVRTATERLGTCVVRLYGSTEFPTISAGRTTDDLDRRAETDGWPIGRTRVRIVDDDGAEVPRGGIGELQARGPELFLGYLDEAATRAAFTADGWFRSGDLAVVEADGAVVIRGRKKDIIIRGGENISVKEVEDLLLDQPGVREVAIVAMPDPVMVERMCAYVAPEEGFRPTLEELNRALVDAGLMRQKLPERLEIVDELPKTASGKVKKFQLRTEIAALVEAERTTAGA